MNMPKLISQKEEDKDVEWKKTLSSEFESAYLPVLWVLINEFIYFYRFDRHDIDAAIIESAAKREEPYRIVVLGPEKVGKTALICRFLEKEFPLKHKATTEQTNFGTYTLAGVKVKLEILDTSGKNEVCIRIENQLGS